MLKWIIGLGVFALVLVLWSVNIIPAGFQGVVTQFGAVKSQTLSPGFHVVTPFVDQVHRFDTREQKEQVGADSASRDLQSVTTTVALNFHLDPAKVNQLYQEIGREYKERIIDPAIQESVKAATAQFSAEELITKRPEVKEQLRVGLTDRLAPRYIVVNDVSIVNFNFSEDFDKSIEAKQVAQQNALKAEQDLKRIEVEAKQSIERAKAEAEALRLQRENATTELIELRKVEAQIKAIEKWNGTLPNVSGGAIPFINVGEGK